MTAGHALLRRVLIAGLSLALVPVLAACGFQPLYSSAPYRDLPGVEVETGPTRLDYLVEDALEEEFGNGRSAYRLVVSTRSSERALGVSAEARARRYRLRLIADYTLFRGADQIVEGQIREPVYFDAPADPYGLMAARLSAEQQGADALARSIARQVALDLRRSQSEADRTGEG